MLKFNVGMVATLATLFVGINCVSAEEISIIVGGGIQGDAAEKAFSKPFEAETGIKVNTLKIQPGSAKLRLQMEAGAVDFDAALLLENTGNLMMKDGLLAPIDYSIYKPEELANLDPSVRLPWGVEGWEVGFIMATNSKFYGEGKPTPKTWADFWNVKTFPGRRMLMSGQNGIQGPWEEALLADGVAVEDLYPLDIDRIFASLNKIRPNIRKWWTGSEVEQLMSSGSMDATMSFDTSATLVRDAGHPIDINYAQAKVYGVYWFIPKASPNEPAAQKFLEFVTRAKQQAKFAELNGAAPSNAGAFNLLTPEVASKLISFPENKATSYRINQSWYSEKGKDGLTNADRLRDRWNTWIAQ